MSVLRIVILLVTGMLLSAAAFSLEPPRPSSEAQHRGCYAVRIEALGSTASPSTLSEGKAAKAKAKAKARPRNGHRFSAREILDLRFDVLLRERDPSGLVEVALYTPSGHLYETLKAELVPDEAALGRASYRGRRARVVAATLPVAGSFITRRSIYGEWRAEVRLDGAGTACTRPTSFTLEP